MHSHEDASTGRIKQRSLPLLGFVACVIGEAQVASSYEHFLLPQTGVTFVPERELAFYAYFTLFGLSGLWCLARLFGSFAWHDRFAALIERRPVALAWSSAGCVLLLSALFRRYVLEGQAIADDEATYVFIARTLLQGRLVNPVPEDAELFRNQFVVLDQQGWYGKYPIGHPLVLALAELVRLRELVVPLMAALCAPLTFALGRRWFGDRRAVLGTLLLVLSPHFVGTAGTLLSQTTACLVLLLGTWLAVRAVETGRALLALAAGLAFGFGVLVRPLPGVLFAAVAVAWSARIWLAAQPPERAAGLVRVALLALGSATGVAAVLAVNYVQTGDALSSGYHRAHGSVVVFNNDHGDLASSLAGALLRESFWLLGVPACLLPVLFARPQRWAALFWGLLAAELAYRLISPKTMVATTGPVYLTEVVPLLLLAVVDGLCQLRERVRFDGRTSQLTAVPLMAAVALVAGCMFLPVQWRTLRRGVEARLALPDALEQAGAQRALVFADVLVHPSSVFTWAYFPDNPSPDFSDDILYVRMPKPASTSRAIEIWQRRFSDRRAFALSWNQRGEPALEELSARR
jgi:hypothetical protein